MLRLHSFIGRTTVCLALTTAFVPVSADAGRPRSPRVALTDAVEVAGAPSASVTGADRGVSSSSAAEPTPRMVSAVLSDSPTHLLIGRSAYVTSQKRLSSIYITNPSVLSA